MAKIIKIDKEIKKIFEHTFNISESGLYIIEIIASAKSWWQNLKEWRTFFNDDDLAIKIDGIEFPKLNGKGGLFDGEAAWNGNNLKGLKKTGIFILNLKSGDHKIEFIADERPYLESIKTEKVLCDLESPAADNVLIEYAPSDENKKAQDGNNRQWINLVFAELPIQEIVITAKAEKREKDSDDIKLVIDCEIQKNPDSKKFKNWYWCGSLDDKTKSSDQPDVSDTEKEGWKEFKKELNLLKGLHYIELWADRMPSLENIKIILKDAEEMQDGQDEKQQITAKVVWEITKFRSEPKLDEENILGELKEGDKVEIMEKAIRGDRPKNINNQYLLSNRWHKVKYKGQEGYIYSEALEICGESIDEIKGIIIEKSKELAEDENLILAVAETESVFQPYRVSYDSKNPEADIAYGIMQITPIAIQQVEDDYQYKVIDKFDLHQNTEGGIRYFQYLRTLYNDTDPEYLEKLLISYNCGAGCITSKDAINYSFLSVDIKEYVEKVKDIYEKNKNQNQAGLIKNSILLLSGMILSIMLILGIYHFKFFSKASRAGAKITDNKSIVASAIRVNAEEESNVHYRLEDDLDNNSEIERIEFNAYFHKDGRTTEVFINEREPLYLRGYFFDAYTKDINKDGVKEVVIESAVGANGIWTEIYTYQNGDLKNIPVRANNIFSGFLGAGIKFVDYDDDGDLEVESVHRVSDICQARSDIYEYIEGKFVKAKELIEFEETCRESMKKVTG